MLVVDDDELGRQFICECLIEAGFDIEEAGGGVQALEMLTAHPGDFDTVLLDRRMPDLDGMEVLAKLKRHAALKDVPVVMQTAMDAEEDIIEAVEAGAYYYLTKPFDSGMLISVTRAATNDCARFRRLKRDVSRRMDALGLMSEGYFELRTPKEGNALAVLLAGSLPNSPTVAMGLSELLINAIEHGNLAMDYRRKAELIAQGLWDNEVAKRLADPEYGARVVRVKLQRGYGFVRYRITDEGDGFDWTDFMELTAQRAFDVHGRGIAMARKLAFKELTYLGRGNEVEAVVSWAQDDAVPDGSPDPETRVVEEYLGDALVAGPGQEPIWTAFEGAEAVGRERVLIIGRSDVCNEIEEGLSADTGLIIATLQGNENIRDVVAKGLDIAVIESGAAGRVLPLLAGTGIPVILVSDPERAPFAAQHAVTSECADFVVLPPDKELLHAAVRLYAKSPDTGDAGACAEAIVRAQRTVLPTMGNTMTVANYRVQAHWLACCGVSGDLWGVRQLSGGRLAVYLADFAGHGEEAGFNTLRLASFMAGMPVPADRPDRVMNWLDAKLYGVLPTAQYAAMIYAVLDPVAGLCSYIAAGVPHPVMIDSAGGAPKIGSGRGVPLGVAPGMRRDMRSLPLAEESALFLYSDGLPMAVSGTPVGGTRLPDEVFQAVAETVTSPPGGESPFDKFLSEAMAKKPVLADDLSAVLVTATKPAQLSTA